MASVRVGEEMGRGNGRGGERMGRRRRFGCSRGAREASRWPEVRRAAALRPVAGGELDETKEEKRPGWA
jgi:hypothetical protein